MLTYQDFQKVMGNEDQTKEFVKRLINEHKSSEAYKEAVIAEEYYRHKNRTIVQYQKFLFDLSGKPQRDIWSANYKMASRFFKRFVTQENQYLIGNGVTWTDSRTAEKLGEDFDYQLQKLGRNALVQRVSFGFFNYDHLEVFAFTEFAPLFDETNGALMAGVRYWQIDESKPLRATLYEIDGYTEYIWDRREDSDGVVYQDKRPYIIKLGTSVADGMQIYDGKNYPTFPIVPLWGNPEHTSELTGLREQIDCYDLIKSGYANNVDEGSLIYWTLNNAGGMDDIDLAQFVQKMKTLHASTVDDGVSAESHNLEAPYQSREALLAKLRSDLYEDAMALDTKSIADGVVTATQIKAAYELLNSKTDEYEYCVLDFLDGIMELAEIDDDPSFTRSVIVNVQEEAQLIIQSANMFPEDYVVRKLLTLFGDGDKADDILDQLADEEVDRFRDNSSPLENGVENSTDNTTRMAGNGRESGANNQ